MEETPAGSNPVRPHAVQTAGNNSYQYDANGNTTQRTIGGVTYTLTYDKENRLVSMVSGNLNATYTYNADGTRAKRRVRPPTHHPLLKKQPEIMLPAI